MIKEEPVSMIRQTIYCFIPVLDIYAAYRVRRLRRYLLIMLLIVGIPLVTVDSIMFPSDGDLNPEEFVDIFLLHYDEPDRFPISLTEFVITMLVAIFFIRRWSAQWNQRFV